MAEKKETKVVEKAVDVDAFIRRKLKDINELDDKATARDLADRVRSNRKEN